MIQNFGDGATRSIFMTGSAAGVPEAIALKCSRALDIIDAAKRPVDARIAGRLHRLVKFSEDPLKFGASLGDKWWLTFTWDRHDAIDVKLEFRP